MKPRKKRTLTAAEKRALGATPGLIVHRVDPQGRARLEQLAPESAERRRDFARRLSGDTDDTPASEGEHAAD